MDTTNPKDLVGIKKPPLWLIPGAGLLHTAMAFKDGAKKYEPYNWRERDVRATVYIDASLRHIHSYLDGEDLAGDSGVHHLGHAAACLFIILDALGTGNLIDDRPRPGTTAELIKRFTDGNTVIKKEPPIEKVTGFIHDPDHPLHPIPVVSTVSEGYYTHDTTKYGGIYTGPGSPTEGCTETSGASPVPYYPYKEKALSD